MTVSKDRRQQDIEAALRRMYEKVGDNYFDSVFFELESEDFADLLPTTWKELEEHYLIQRQDTFGSPACELTAAGWRQGVRLLTKMEEDEPLMSSARTLARALKKLVDGRGELYDALTDEKELAHETGLPPGWIWNALISHLIQELFPTHNVTVRYSARQRTFEVPTTFNFPL